MFVKANYVAGQSFVSIFRLVGVGNEGDGKEYNR